MMRRLIDFLRSLFRRPRVLYEGDAHDDAELRIIAACRRHGIAWSLEIGDDDEPTFDMTFPESWSRGQIEEFVREVEGG